jgi:antitoxin CcdA
MQDRAKPRKRAVNLSIDADLLEEAKAAGTNLSAVLEEALRDELKDRRWQSWRNDNRAAIESMNRYVAKHGLLSDKYRVR